ncbi:MAG: hypothetical protein SF029_17635 [bacterium]|nr:hypothetical protein [bacterium]
MPNKTFNPKNIIRNIIGQGKVVEPVDLRRVYHEYPKPVHTEPRHMFSGEYPAVMLETMDEADLELQPAC